MSSYYDDYIDEDDYFYRMDRFADPGGESALYAESEDNPRNLPCPTCGFPDRLTPRDRAKGYQCDNCADATELGLDIVYYEGDE